MLVLAASHFSLKTGHLGYSAAQLSSRTVWAAFRLGVVVRRGAPRVGEELGGGATGAQQGLERRGDSPRREPGPVCRRAPV